MNINAGNPSLQNIITRTLMGKKEKRPSFEEVFNKLSKNSAMMNTRMPLNSALTNEQMYRCYVQNTMPKLQKSNDTFGESELNSVLMKLLGNDPSGNALTPTPLATTGGTVPLPATGGASLGTLPLATATVLPTTATVLPTTTPVSAPTAPVLPTLSPVLPTLAPVLPTLAPVLPTPVPALSIAIPPTGATSAPAPSPVILAATSLGGSLGTSLINIASGLFSPNPTIAGLPTAPPPPPPVLPVANLGAAFTSVATPVLTQDELAAQLNATTVLADFNKPQLEQVINVRGPPLRSTKDPLEMEISAGNQLLNKIRTRGIDPKDLTGDIKINYDRALELRRQVTAKSTATKARKEAALATKEEKDARRQSILSQSGTVSGSPQPETKAQKATRNRIEKAAKVADKEAKEKIAKSAKAGAAGGI